jgi:AcrR family transcriptional regulator
MNLIPVHTGPVKRRGSRAARRDAIRERLVTIVKNTLEAGESYGDISVARLVAEADISRSTFYTYFEDKGQLLRDVAQDVVADIEAAGSTWWSLPPDVPTDKLRAAIRSTFEAYRLHGPLWRAVVEAAAYEPVVYEQFMATMNRGVEEITTYIRSCQEYGQAGHDMDAEATAAWITWMAERGVHQLIQPADDEKVERLTTAFTQIIWKLTH